MLVTETSAARRGADRARIWRYLFLFSAALSLMLGATLLPHLSDSAELVRLRNAMLLQSEPATFDWNPASVPAGFAVETAPPLPLYAHLVAANQLKVEGDDWATALAIGRHMLPEGKRSGGAIQSDLTDSYERIVHNGEGYCGDYADSFTGLATAAGIFSRPWAFSFDGFGGRGHIFNEIWDSQRARWVMIDVFNNFYAVGEDGEPLSAIGLRTALQAPGPGPRLIPVDTLARPGFRYDDKAIEYYRRGLPEWYMWWGNNVFEYDQAPLTRLLGQAPRALEQLGGVLAGNYPGFRILQSSDNEQQRKAIARLQLQLLALAVAAVLALLCLVGWRLAVRRASRARSRI